MTFDGKLTYSDGNLTFFIDNNNGDSPKFLTVYGETKDTIHLSVSKMDIVSNNTLKDESISIDPNQIQPLNGSKQVTINIARIPTGSSQGWIIIPEKSYSSIPISISTEPKYIEAIAWVIVGILISIIIWELILYFKPIKEALQTAVASGANEVATAAEAAGGENTEVAEQARRKSDEISNQRKAAIKAHRHYYADLRYPKRMGAPIHPVPSSQVVLVDIITIFFGIAVGLLALLSQGYIGSISAIGPTEVLALVGLGLGIGSIHSQS